MIIDEIDVLASHKHFEVYRQTRPRKPERKLMLAVLVDAVQTYQKFAFSTSIRGQALFREAERWFWNEDSDAGFSFPNICDVFGFDPGLFRRGLLKRRVTRNRRGPLAKIVQLRSPANRSRRPTFSAPYRASCSFGRGRRDV